MSKATGGGAAGAGAGEPFRDKERRDLLLCLLHVISCLEDEVLVSWLSSLSPNDRLDFLEILEIALDSFRYEGRTKTKTFESISYSGALANKDRRQGIRGFRTSKHMDETDAAAERKAADVRWVAEGHVSAQAGLAALHAVCVFWQHFQRDLLAGNSEAPAFRRVVNAYLQLLDLRQCEPLLRHAFASLRLFVARFASVLFAPGSPSACVHQLCACVLRCGESRQAGVRQLAAGLLYLMARQNQAVAGSAKRLHSQAMVALAGQAEHLSESPKRLRRFEACLSLLGQLGSGSSDDIADLCRSLLAVLRTTAAFAMHRGNPEMCVDLHWQLAASYRHTPSLRLTYLRNMAERHAGAGHLTEAAFCVLHQAALTAEVLRVRGEHPNGFEAFAALSPNVAKFERRFGDDLPQEERDGCSLEGLTELIQQAADLLSRAERFELVAPCLRPALEFHEERRDYRQLAALYQQCAAACKAVVDTRGKRFLESFYRVGLFGDLFVEQQQVFVYKEPGLTRLAELAERLRAVFEARFGADKVTMLTDSGEVDPSKLEPGRAFVQITFLQPLDTQLDGNTSQFVLETPFTRTGDRHGTSVEDQWRRRTRLTTEAAFPTVVKRLKVVRSEHEDLSPLAVAVLELRAMSAKIRSAAESEPPDMKRLQMVLQGCLATQVHAGPNAYAQAFLAPNRRIAYIGDQRLLELENEFTELLRACKLGLRVNKALVRSDQLEYHQCLVSGYEKLRDQLQQDNDDTVSLGSQFSQLDSCA